VRTHGSAGPGRGLQGDAGSTNASDRFELLGTYRTAKVRISSVLSCEFRDDDVIVVGYTVGRIPWPAPPGPVIWYDAWTIARLGSRT
jgi:hypothetical protein